MLKLKSSASQPAPKPPGTKLRLGGSKSSPAPPNDASAASTAHTQGTGVTVDSDSLRRQREHIQAGVNGHTSEQRPAPRNPFGGTGPSSAAPPIPDLSRSQQNSSAGSPPLSASNVKAETGLGTSASPAPQAVRSVSGAPDGRGPSPLTNPAMPPPLTAPRIPSGSPLPNGHTPAPHAPISHGSIPHSQTSGHSAMGGLSNRLRDADNPVSKALLPHLSISSQANTQQASTSKPFHLDIPAHPKLTQHSVTIILPSQHNTLRIVPKISEDVLKHRPYRTFVSLNNARLLGIPLKQKIAAEGVNGTTNGADGLSELKENEEKLQVFEARLQPGVNRIEVEVVVGKQRGGSDKNGPEIEGEKVSVFVNLMRA